MIKWLCTGIQPIIYQKGLVTCIGLDASSLTKNFEIKVVRYDLND